MPKSHCTEEDVWYEDLGSIYNFDRNRRHSVMSQVWETLVLTRIGTEDGLCLGNFCLSQDWNGRLTTARKPFASTRAGTKVRTNYKGYWNSVFGKVVEGNNYVRRKKGGKEQGGKRGRDPKSWMGVWTGEASSVDWLAWHIIRLHRRSETGQSECGIVLVVGIIQSNIITNFVTISSLTSIIVFSGSIYNHKSSFLLLCLFGIKSPQLLEIIYYRTHNKNKKYTKIQYKQKQEQKDRNALCDPYRPLFCSNLLNTRVQFPPFSNNSMHSSMGATLHWLLAGSYATDSLKFLYCNNISTNATPIWKRKKTATVSLYATNQVKTGTWLCSEWREIQISCWILPADKVR
ncbi:hypothetical protein VP01_372g1 [Puccinia sorghi]|uniref:Uncharacterized protein n=1 Tax=Puccinia sorghi TaxID=27349 RepID=A0A0L6UTZ7_9BASI|nr:hypothetical protein VP01_372g1 [Puccinia sorghi]